MVLRIIRDRGWSASGLQRIDFKWLAGSVLFGGILAPVCLMMGLSSTSAAASLMLNFESLFTALSAWIAFKEHTDRRIIIGMLLIFTGGLALSGSFNGSTGTDLGTLWIVLACLGWALDLTFPLGQSLQ